MRHSKFSNVVFQDEEKRREICTMIYAALTNGENVCGYFISEAIPLIIFSYMGMVPVILFPVVQGLQTCGYFFFSVSSLWSASRALNRTNVGA